MTPRRMPVGPEAVSAALRVVKRGGIVAIPTDTVYGLACDPRSDIAVKGLFEAKGRESKPIPVLCSDLAAAAALVALNPAATALAGAHWPGALTIVAPLRPRTGLSRLLDQGSGQLGVRVPGSEFCTALARKAGGCVTGTSANLSGSPSCRTAEQVAESLGSRVQLIVDGGTLTGKESTVVRVSASGVEVLREGSVRIQEGDLKA